MKFARFCQALSNWAGSSKTFLLAIALIGVWALTGPYFHYNDTWQLIINTSTTIITFLMVFLIQNTQNRDNDILHLKIDELIRATKDAQNATLSLDKMGSRDLRKLRDQYSSLGENDQVDLRSFGRMDNLADEIPTQTRSTNQEKRGFEGEAG
ncbi:low affinity iron permease family protein [Pseudomonas rhodesiae]